MPLSKLLKKPLGINEGLLMGENEDRGGFCGEGLGVGFSPWFLVVVW